MSATTKKKVTADPVDPPVYDRRPDEVVVEATPRHGHRAVLVPDPARQRFLDHPSYVVQPGTPTLLPGHLFKGPADDASLLVKDGQLGLLDADRGVLPEVVDPNSDPYRHAMVLRGRPPEAPRRVLIEGLTEKYAVEFSVGETILLLVEAGWDEAEAAKVIRREYLDSFERQNGDATRRSWVALGQMLLKQTRHREEVK